MVYKYKKKKGIPETVSKVMSKMGQIGGSRKSAKQLAAWRENISHSNGRPRLYNYVKKTKAVIGTLNPRHCTIPDEVAERPEKYKTKSFPAYWSNMPGGLVKENRINVVVLSVEDDVIHVKRLGGHYSVRKKKK